MSPVYLPFVDSDLNFLLLLLVLCAVWLGHRKRKFESESQSQRRGFVLAAGRWTGWTLLVIDLDWIRSSVRPHHFFLFAQLLPSKWTFYNAMTC